MTHGTRLMVLAKQNEAIDALHGDECLRVVVHY